MLHARLIVLLFLAARQPAFDVASVKQNRSSIPANSNFPLGPGDAYTQNGGYFNATNFPLFLYISFAYKIMPSQAQFLRDQLPAWATTERFDIQARAQGSPGKDEMRLLMRTLLAERFKLALHVEQRVIPVAALVPAKAGKLGPQIQRHPAGAPCPKDILPGGTTADGRFPLLCGGILQLGPSAPGRVRYGARDVTLEFIATSLSTANASGRPMIDRTALSGTFDFNLEWTPDSDAQPDLAGPTFEQALREQLGLKLVSQKASTPVLVLDHVERLTGN
jgi:uncharacterized protein (TIGR03435 family)